MGKFFGRLEVGWEKVACWSTKAAISLSLKRVKIEEKLLWRAYRKSPTLFPTVPFPTPYGLLFPKIGVRNPYPKLQSLLSQERVKLRTSNFACTFMGSSEQKPIRPKISVEVDVGIVRDSRKFSGRYIGRIARSSLR